MPDSALLPVFQAPFCSSPTVSSSNLPAFQSQMTYHLFTETFLEHPSPPQTITFYPLPCFILRWSPQTLSWSSAHSRCSTNVSSLHFQKQAWAQLLGSFHVHKWRLVGARRKRPLQAQEKGREGTASATSSLSCPILSTASCTYLVLTLHFWKERHGFENMASGHPASCKCTIDFSR